MKYYIYISDTKLDMLVAQVPRGILASIAAELSINVKVVGITLKTTPSDETRYTKLALVSSYIEKNESVGDVDTSKHYLRGTLDMAWGLIKAGTVCFAARTDRTDVVLAGSSAHVLGGGGTPIEISPSIDPYSALASVAEAMEPQPYTPVNVARQIDFAADWVLRERPTQKLEFLAMQLASWPNESSGRVSLLGSPIYVAYADG